MAKESPSLPILEEACAVLPHTTRAMFGGHGLFAPNGGIFAAVVDDDRIVLKFADEVARAEFKAIGGRAWTYSENMTMREWLLAPDALYDEPRELAAWAARAHRLAPPKKARSKTAGSETPAQGKRAKSPAKVVGAKLPAKSAGGKSPSKSVGPRGTVKGAGAARGGSRGAKPPRGGA